MFFRYHGRYRDKSRRVRSVPPVVVWLRRERVFGRESSRWERARGSTGTLNREQIGPSSKLVARYAASSEWSSGGNGRIAVVVVAVVSCRR